MTRFAPAVGQELLQVPPAALTPDPDNPREGVGDIGDLARSMDDVGLLQPIVARRTPDGALIVVAGHRRLAAARHLSWRTVPVVVRTDMRPDEVLVAMLVENGQRQDLDPIEEARAYKRLKIEHGLTDLELAGRLGRAQVTVSARIALLALPVEEQEKVRSGETTIGNAVREARLTSGKARPRGNTGAWHLSPEHTLAARAKSRCLRLEHPRGRRVGGVACGSCWESVIRADEREHLHEHAVRAGRCSVCDTPVTRMTG